MNNFNDILQMMRDHNMKTPSVSQTIEIANSKLILTNAMSYFIGLEGKDKKSVWLPEYEKVAEWLENNEGKGLFLYGNCGRGKSVLCRYVLPAIVLKYSRRVIKAYDVQEMNKELDDILRKQYISLDDIGTESMYIKYGEKRSAFNEILDAAEKYRKVLIVSTNLNQEKIIERYGERAMERIIATMKRVLFQGESLRK